IPPAGGMSLITKWLTHVIRWLYFMSQVAQKDGKAGSIPWQYSSSWQEEPQGIIFSLPACVPQHGQKQSQWWRTY
ncbi:hypothetical protein, partial [Siminovitchia sediminis]|uniref:hypothetical protein n=1 Tax=Siminovitchia sediminis TaxID=1274353 RepID=UPI0036D31107